MKLSECLELVRQLEAELNVWRDDEDMVRKKLKEDLERAESRISELEAAGSLLAEIVSVVRDNMMKARRVIEVRELEVETERSA
jgi:hypothetical protein